MKQKKLLLLSFILLCCHNLIAQTNSIDIKAKLNVKNDLLHIQQKTVFYNNSSVNLNTIFLHNWANSFKNNKTPLAKRFIEDYKKDFFFAKQKDKGYSKIHRLSINFKQVKFKEQQSDIIKVDLHKTLKPNDSIILTTTYTVKIPNAKYTGYGKTKTGYHLRFWHLIPAVHQKQWKLQSNLNLDDLYQNLSNYKIHINIPQKYIFKSNLNQIKEKGKTRTNYYLTGKKKKDIILHIDSIKTFVTFKTKKKRIKTDLYLNKIPRDTTVKIINKQLNFIEQFLGKNPHKEILVDATTVNKNSLYEIYGLPKILKPFPKNFRWEISFFRALSKKYLEDVFITDKRTDSWLTEGVGTVLMMKYNFVFKFDGLIFIFFIL